MIRLIRDITALIVFVTSVGTATIIPVPQEQPTIQAGIDAAMDGDTVLVETGRYVENINFHGKNLVLGSWYLFFPSFSYVSETVIDGGSDTSVVIFGSGEEPTARLIGFTITNGNAAMGGGILITSGSSPTIQHNSIEENHAGWCGGVGGGIAVSDFSHPVISNNMILRNTAGGVCDCICYFGGGIWVDSTSNPAVGGNVFEDNFADIGFDLYREGDGQVIDATHNAFEYCPPTESGHVFPPGEFDVSECSYSPLRSTGNLNDRLPRAFSLHQNYPNPFNPATTIEFAMPVSGNVVLIIYDILGREVTVLVEGWQAAGWHTIQWDAGDVPSGIYFVRMQTQAFAKVRKVTVLR